MIDETKLPDGAVRVTIRKRGVRDAQDPPLYSIVAGGTGLHLMPGQSVDGWFLPEFLDVPEGSDTA